MNRVATARTGVRDGLRRSRWWLLAAVAALVTACGGSSAARQGEPDESNPPPARDLRDELLIVSRRGWRTDFSRHVVPLIEFQSGGPGRDGIPAIDHPRLTTVEAARRWLQPREPVMELVVDGEARAYPLQILVWHEIVNDTLAGSPIAVTYCPLCNSAAAFARRLGSRTLTFGTTGNLRHYDLVMYDRQTESWWQQFDGTALVGKLAGTRLSALPAPLRAWREFAREHPDGTVLSRDTGHRRPYGHNPYAGLDAPRRSATECGLQAVLGSTPLCATGDDRRLPPRERVVLVERGADALAVPFHALRRARTIRVRVGGEAIDIDWRPGQRSPFARSHRRAGKAVGSVTVRSTERGSSIPASTPYWFAVAAFRPGIRIWTAPDHPRVPPGTSRAAR